MAADEREPRLMSTPMMHGRLRALVAEMGLRPVRKNDSLKALVEWTIHDLPELAPDDPRTARAVELARYLWQHSRDIGGRPDALQLPRPSAPGARPQRRVVRPRRPRPRGSATTRGVIRKSPVCWTSEMAGSPGGPEHPHDAAVLQVLRERDGQPTEARLSDGRTMTVVNIAWGYDLGDEFAHVTTNVSPDVEGQEIDFFFTSEVESLADTTSGEVLFSGQPLDSN